jgi:PAS domain S-box-containing protein
MLSALNQPLASEIVDACQRGRRRVRTPAPDVILHIVHGKVAGAVLAGMLMAGTCACALNPALDVSQYAHTAWKVRDGFAKGSILSIAQTPDGYLWLGTAFGLYRFDGVRNVLWQPPLNQHLPSGTITKLVAAQDGVLWIGTRNGLASWKNGKLTQYAELVGLEIDALVEDNEGSIWVGTNGPSDGKLCEIRNGSVRCHPEMGGVGRGVFGLHRDGKGNLWVGLETGVWRWRPGPPEFYAVPGLLNGRMQGMADGEDGALLIATTGAVTRLADGKAEAVYRFPAAKPGFRRLVMLRDRDGGLWVCPAGRGIVHIYLGRTDVFSESDGLSGDDIYDLFEDREGDIWVATVNGLDRFHELPMVTYSKKQGLSDIPWGGMLAARNGTIWFGTLNGLNRLSHGQVTVYRQHRTARGQEVVGSGLPDEGVGSLFQDSRGRIWVSTLSGIGYLENDRFIPAGAPSGLVESLTEDTSGNTWIANRDVGLLRLSSHNELQQIPWATFGRKDPAVVLAPDPLHGGLWLGFSHGGVAWFRDGHVQSSFSAADSLGGGRVNQLRFDAEGALWIASEGGLSRLKNGRIVTLTSKSGLPCDAVQWTMEDDAQLVWIMMPCGLVRVARSELDVWASAADKTDRTIHATVFDSSDGLRLLAVVGDYTPRVAKSSDGKLWFSVPDGISVVDPRHLPFNKLLPPVHVEQVIADRKEYGENLSGDAPSNLRLPPLVRELEINYTALSLAVPEKVRFRYRLDGVDNDWQDAGTRRDAFYTRLGPGEYHFRVIACNIDGVWNEEGAHLDFDIAPAWYQTIWFRLLCVAAFLAFLWGLHRLRMQQLRLEERKLREAIETIPAMALILGPDGAVQFRNRRWVEYTGLSQLGNAEGFEKTAIYPEDLDRIVRRWGARLASGEPYEDEMRVRSSDGQYRWFLARAVPLRDKRGKVVKWYGAAIDIQDRKRAEQLQAELAHTNRVSTMGEMVASISHELAQPIQITTAHAKASLRWLQRDPPEVSEARNGTEKIIEAGALASEIIGRLRSLYKKSHPKRELVAINEVISEMAGMMRGEARGHGVSIRTDLKDDLPMTVADRVQLQQVLMNLMLNGIEAMKATGGVLTVKSQLREDRQVEISVKDTGPGLPLGKADQIFDAFFTTKSQGSGMGLAICKSIVESQGGRIWANGDGGRGATFHFTLPAAPAETKPPAA